MRTFNFTLLAMVSYVAMVGATLRMHRASGVIDRRQNLGLLNSECTKNPNLEDCAGLCAIHPDIDLCQKKNICAQGSALSICLGVLGVSADADVGVGGVKVRGVPLPRLVDVPDANLGDPSGSTLVDSLLGELSDVVGVNVGEVLGGEDV